VVVACNWTTCLPPNKRPGARDAPIANRDAMPG
jgi:hypothetical protein